MNNDVLNNARSDKFGEFYTLRGDIAAEMEHHKRQFKDKVVGCNSDDPRVSSFVNHFVDNYEALGIKGLIATCYKNTQDDMFSQHNANRAVYLEWFGSKPPTIDALKGKP